AVLIGKFEPMLAQDLCEAIKGYGIICADGVVGNGKFQGQRDECERDNAGRAQIAFGVHPKKLQQLECPGAVSLRRPRTNADQRANSVNFRDPESVGLVPVTSRLLAILGSLS